MKVINSEQSLIKYINHTVVGEMEYDAIVVEGYDGVGKGRVLSLLSDYFSVTPYRPDYNLWQQHDHRPVDRWKVSAFFWDIFNHFDLRRPGRMMLFDRGVLSGAVYNHDISIAKDYLKILGKAKVMHILVTCDTGDFKRFQQIRNPDITEFELGYKWNDCVRYSEEYLRCFDIAGVDYIIYNNIFNEAIAEDSSKYCAGCGHYSYGICRHPDINKAVDSNQLRCSLSKDVETQDKEEISNDAEMHCV